MSVKLIGKDDATGSSETKDYLILTKFTASASGKMTEFRVKAGGSGNIKVALYADNSGNPGTLITAMNTGQAVTAGWNTLNFTQTQINNGTVYWLAIIIDTNNACQYVSGGNYQYKVQAYTDFTYPSTISGLESGGSSELVAGWGTLLTSNSLFFQML
jgi:hypothetical protein